MGGEAVSGAAQGAHELEGRRIAVVGLGKSGRGCLAALAGLGRVRLSAWDAAEDALGGLDAVPLDAAGHSEDPADLASRVLAWKPDVVIPAPAVPETGALFAAVEGAGVPLWSEIDLAWRLRAVDGGEAAPWLCVTGTNGKTTTTGMTASILRAAGLGGLAVGNIGAPAVQAVTQTGPHAPRAFAVELSSFQLRTTHTVSPLASVCLNVADDHLEWHGSREAYWAAKARVYDRVRSARVYPVGDRQVARMVEGAPAGARTVGVTLGPPSAGQIGLVGDVVADRAYGAGRPDEAAELFTLQDLAHLAAGPGLPAHVVWDALAAAALARAAGAPPESVRRGLRDFAPGRHRIETVARVGGVAYVDDSKATNAHAARACLASLEEGTAVWIVGGLAKGARFDGLVEDVAGKLRGVVVIGVDQEPWRSALARAADVPAVYVDPRSGSVMAEAVAAARRMAEPGDTVLLAPACASMDQFASYAERGEAFAAAVRSLDG